MLIGILEDDISQLELFSYWLKLDGHQVRPYSKGRPLLAGFKYERLEALMLDWDVADVSGMEVLRHVREVSSIPVLFCTARRREVDIVQALRAGADYFVAKPVGRAELLARIHSITRHLRERRPVVDVVQIYEFQLDYRDHMIKRNGRPIELSPKEFELSVLFLRNIGRGLSREHISRSLFPGLSMKSRSLDTHVAQIRVKLGLHEGNGWFLSALYRKGYRLDRPRITTSHANEVARDRPRKTVFTLD
ncbi:MAG: response regulator transcription factor [Betaproteobacteria bacterium]